jgi:brefeldin A-inhibited guanine nucleotide-exchange protein
LSHYKLFAFAQAVEPLCFNFLLFRFHQSQSFFHYINYLWLVCAGLSELSFDPRPEVRKSALQVLFETLRNHGHLFSLPLWERVFESVLFPIFDYVRHAIDPPGGNSPEQGIDGDMGELDQDAWLYGTCTLALQLVVDLFVKFYNTVNPLLRKVLSLLVSFIRRPHQSLAGIGIAAFVRLMSNAGDMFSEEKWLEVVLSLKDAANATLPDFSYIVSGESSVIADEQNNGETAGSDMPEDESEGLVTHHLYASISDAKCRAAVQLLLIQVLLTIYFDIMEILHNYICVCLWVLCSPSAALLRCEFDGDILKKRKM